MNNFLDIFTPARQMMSARPERFLYNSPLFVNFPRSLAVDIDEDGKQYIITTDLPGFDVEDVDVSIENNVLHIVAEHTETFSENTSEDDKDSVSKDKPSKEQELNAEKDERKQNLVQERSNHKRLERRIDLGTKKVDEEKIQASLDKGVLKLLVPYIEEDKKKRINIDIRKSILMWLIIYIYKKA